MADVKKVDDGNKWLILFSSGLLMMFLFMIQMTWSIGIGSTEPEPGDIQSAFGGISSSQAMLGLSIVIFTQGVGNFFQGNLVQKLGFKNSMKNKRTPIFGVLFN